LITASSSRSALLTFDADDRADAQFVVDVFSGFVDAGRDSLMR